jgi:hypothetical protein
MCHTCHEAVRCPYVPTGAGRGGPGIPRSGEVVADRLAEFAVLRGWGYTVRAAADRVGVSWRTGCRYEARLKVRLQEEKEVA